MDNDNVTYGDYWIAYFDILGFENLVRQLHIENLRAKYKKVTCEIKRERLGVSCKWFSDTFLLYKKDDSKKSFWEISCASQLFFRHIFTEWLPMRGCLNFGKFYVDEEEGIFLGTSLIEAYKTAESQSWIGLVLSPNVRARLKECNIPKGNFEQCYCEHEVPCKSGKRRNLLAYNLKLCSTRPLTQEEEDKQAKQLWESLRRMQNHARDSLQLRAKEAACSQKHEQDRNVIAKYENTRKFLLEVFPILKNIQRNRNHSRLNTRAPNDE